MIEASGTLQTIIVSRSCEEPSLLWRVFGVGGIVCWLSCYYRTEDAEERFGGLAVSLVSIFISNLFWNDDLEAFLTGLSDNAGTAANTNYNTIGTICQTTIYSHFKQILSS